MKDEQLEIIFVDDGSTDDSLGVLEKLSAQHDDVHYISFSRNFGHQNALKSGFDVANGNCVITIDGDMQHPVEMLPEMIASWRQGADVVHTRRAEDPTLPAFKRVTSKLYYKIFQWCANTAIEPGTADFRLIDRCIVDICRQARDDSFFWRGFIPWAGFRQVVLDYQPQVRLHGVSSYTVKKMFHLAWAGISAFSLLPLRLASALGALGLIFSVFYAIYVIVTFIGGASVTGWASLILVSLFFGSMQLLTLGILGEYVGKIYINSKHRPHYIIQSASAAFQSVKGKAEQPYAGKC